MKPSRSRHSDARRGMLSMELVLTIPVLLAVLFGVFEFSLLFLARSSVVEASRAGARKATLPGVQKSAVEDEVRRVLKPRVRERAEIEVRRGPHSGDPVSVEVSVPMRSAAPDLLWPIGYSIRGRFIRVETNMTRE